MLLRIHYKHYVIPSIPLSVTASGCKLLGQRLPRIIIQLLVNFFFLISTFWIQCGTVDYANNMLKDP